VCFAVQDEDVVLGAGAVDDGLPSLVLGVIAVQAAGAVPPQPQPQPQQAPPTSEGGDAAPSLHVPGASMCIRSVSDVHCVFVSSELELLDALVQAVHEWDPDFLVGYEVRSSSWGYILDRAKLLGVPIAQRISRLPASSVDPRNENDSWGESHGSGIWVVGRLILNLWRIMRGELKLPIYTFENVVYHVTRERVPFVHAAVLAKWFGSPVTQWQTLRYVLSRAAGNLSLLVKMDLVGRTSEMARLIGIDFHSVLTRGSQYRVEAVMFRVAKPRGFVMPSPSPEQVASQAAMECIPLVMEPVSRFHVSPVIVLDFQSLYPSVIIAYNMCYSTCLGRLSSDKAKMNGRLGFDHYRAGPGLLRAQQSGGFVTPNGVVFADKASRVGVLPTMLREILDTRLMVKRAMKRKEVVDDAVLSRVMDARQLALKFIANVTYGYTAAGFSGRMPCVEIGDAIVQTGRAVLETAIRLVESDARWDARVVYGDSVLPRVPILLRVRSTRALVVRCIADVECTWTRQCDGKLVGEPLVAVDAWSDRRWTPVHAVIRHAVAKRAFRVWTSDSCVDVTEDHSLLDVGGAAVTPKAVAPLCTRLLHSPLQCSGVAPTLSYAWSEAALCAAGEQLGHRLAWRPVRCRASLQRDAGLAARVFVDCGSDGARRSADGSLAEVAVLPPQLRHAFVAGILAAAVRRLPRGRCAEHACAVCCDGREAAQLCLLLRADGVPVAVCDSDAVVCTCLHSTPCQGCCDRVDASLVARVDDLGVFVGDVYDLSTGCHHFQAGVGSLVVHNTDSLFVSVENRSREDAFRIGEEIAARVTQCMPHPITLKFEKARDMRACSVMGCRCAALTEFAAPLCVGAGVRPVCSVVKEAIRGGQVRVAAASGSGAGQQGH
jgi:DNA polymerase zeta